MKPRRRPLLYCSSYENLSPPPLYFTPPLSPLLCAAISRRFPHQRLFPAGFLLAPLPLLREYLPAGGKTWHTENVATRFTSAHHIYRHTYTTNILVCSLYSHPLPSPRLYPLLYERLLAPLVSHSPPCPPAMTTAATMSTTR